MAKNPLRMIGLILTHGIAASVGGAIWLAMRSDTVVTDEEKAAEISGKPRFRSEERRERSARVSEGEAILSEIIGANPNNVVRYTSNKDFAEHIRQSSQRLTKEADDLPQAADVAAAAIALIEMTGKPAVPGTQMTPEMIAEWQRAPARLLHWMRKDPDAAIAYLAKNNAQGRYTQVINAAITEQGPVAASKWLSKDPGLAMHTQFYLGTAAGSLGDPEVLAGVKANLPENSWNQVRNMVASSWPDGKYDEMLSFAGGEDNPSTLLMYVQRQGGKGYEWLKAKLASGDLDPALQESILKSPSYRGLFMNGSEIPFEERVEFLSQTDIGKDPKQLKLEIGGRDVESLMRKGRDYRYAFHSGAMTFEEIYQATAEKLPELAKNAPDAIRNQLYKDLAQANPEAAIAALDQFPAEEKWEMALKPARWTFNGANPQAFYDYVQHIPVDASETSWQTRLEAWNEQTQPNFQKLDKGYSEWVLNLPEGPDREMASYNLLKHVRDKESDLAVSLRGAVKDPRLIERMTNKP